MSLVASVLFALVALDPGPVAHDKVGGVELRIDQSDLGGWLTAAAPNQRARSDAGSSISYALQSTRAMPAISSKPPTLQVKVVAANCSPAKVTAFVRGSPERLAITNAMTVRGLDENELWFEVKLAPLRGAEDQQIALNSPDRRCRGELIVKREHLQALRVWNSKTYDEALALNSGASR